jgi:hypothetical protein
MPGIRELTKEQFADGTTIDGNRIDIGVGDVVDRFNNIQPRDLKKRWVPNTIISGWAPSQFYNFNNQERPLPWVGGSNSISASVATGTTAPDAVLNDYIVKGMPLAQDYMSQSIHTSNPIIIQHVDAMFLLDDPAEPNAYFVGAWETPPAPVIVSDDISVVVQVDNEFNKELRSMDSKVVARSSFVLNNEQITVNTRPTNAALFAAGDDMIPVGFTGGAFTGVHVRMRGLNIPIRRDARVRFFVSIPAFKAWTPTNVVWNHQYYSFTWTILEEIQSG